MTLQRVLRANTTKHNSRGELSAQDFAQWLASARAGSQLDLGKALDACRTYLLLIAEAELGSTLRPKAGASDLVQESLLDAQQGFQHFQGATSEEFYLWISSILRNNLLDLARRYRSTGRRAIDREQSMPSQEHGNLSLSSGPSPSTMVTKAEDSARLHSAIAQLPNDARRVLTLRQSERLSWQEIGDRLGKSAEAVRKIWFRAIERLRVELSDPHAPAS